MKTDDSRVQTSAYYQKIVYTCQDIRNEYLFVEKNTFTTGILQKSNKFK